MTLTAIVQVHSSVFRGHRVNVSDSYSEVFITCDMDPSDNLNLCITKTCLGMDAKTMEVQTEKFVQKIGLLSLAGDKHELGHKLKLLLERDDLRKVRIKA